jgi:hypothetical protein
VPASSRIDAEPPLVVVEPLGNGSSGRIDGETRAAALVRYDAVSLARADDDVRRALSNTIDVFGDEGARPVQLRNRPQPVRVQPL